MIRLFKILSFVFLGILYGCSSGNAAGIVSRDVRLSLLQDSIENFANRHPGEIGVAVIIDTGDTIAVNNDDKYPMMSVFKLHQAISLCHRFDTSGVSLDSVVTLYRDSLDLNTWSPMLKEHQETVIRLPLRRLIEYSLQESDNNASNELFRRMESVEECRNYISGLIPGQRFDMRYMESEMKSDHEKSYGNHTSPLAAAALINRLFTDSLVSGANNDFLRRTLIGCLTGQDRIVAPLHGIKGITIGHKTGSGFINEAGELMAHNDVAYVRLPDGRSYSVAIFVKDFKGDEKSASEIIARISELIYRTMTNDNCIQLERTKAI